MRSIFLGAFLFISLFSFHEVNAQVVFEDYQQNPVFSYSGVSGTFDQMRVYSHAVIKVGSEYWMYYSGVGNGNSVQIGLATSSDGINWNRNLSNPIFTCSENSNQGCNQTSVWSSYRVLVVSVSYEEGQYKMWYSGNNQSVGPNYELGYATSLDGLNWTSSAQNPVYEAESLPGVTYLSVIKTNSGYRLYFTDRVNQDFYYIESSDGINWTGSPMKIGDGSVHTVQKLGDVYLAILDKDVATSSDGKSFNFVNSILQIDNNSDPDQAKVSMLLEDEIVKSWRVHKLGNVIWNYGNFAMNYATLPVDQIYGEVTEDQNPYPLYTQIKSPHPSESETEEWFDDTYANGTAYCGTTIAQCGCAITSLVMAARASGVEDGVDGTSVNPGNLNSWLKANSGYTSFGAVKWAKTFDYFGQEQEQEDEEVIIKTPFKLKYHNTATTSMIQAAATGTEHVIGFSDKVAGGHYFVVSDYVDGDYYIRDPWYYNTKTLDDVGDAAGKVKGYDNDLDKANIIKVGAAEQLAGFLDITLASPAELRLTDEGEKVAGFAEEGNRAEIPTSSYDPTEFIGDPEELPGAPSPHYVKRLMVLEAGGTYLLEVIGTGSGEYTLAISLRDTSGGSHDIEVTASTEIGQIDRYLINMETGEVSLVSVDLEQVFGMIDDEVEGSVLNRFFKKWAEKIFEEIEDQKIRQATEHIDTFQKLMKAKKVESLVLTLTLEKLKVQIEG